MIWCPVLCGLWLHPHALFGLHWVEHTFGNTLHSAAAVPRRLLPHSSLHTCLYFWIFFLPLFSDFLPPLTWSTLLRCRCATQPPEQHPPVAPGGKHAYPPLCTVRSPPITALHPKLRVSTVIAAGKKQETHPKLPII